MKINLNPSNKREAMILAYVSGYQSLEANVRHVAYHEGSRCWHAFHRGLSDARSGVFIDPFNGMKFRSGDVRWKRSS